MNIPFTAGLSGIAAILVEAGLLLLLLGMLQDAGAIRKNYRGQDIPVSAGISFPFTVMIITTGYIMFKWYDETYLLFMLGLMAVSLLGFIDDMLGQRDTLGFRGHFAALFQGRLTTGGLKALGGGFIALFIALHFSGTWIDIAVNTLLMALFTNMLNLMDLRPGRAIKAYLVFLTVVIILAAGAVPWLMITPLLGAVLAYFPWDLRARAMMGDAGSNVLGLALGMLTVQSLGMSGRAGILLFLIIVHIYTEKYSLTATIEKVGFLRKIDNLGRSRADGE